MDTSELCYNSFFQLTLRLHALVRLRAPAVATVSGRMIVSIPCTVLAVRVGLGLCALPLQLCFQRLDFLALPLQPCFQLLDFLAQSLNDVVLVLATIRHWLCGCVVVWLCMGGCVCVGGPE